MASGLASRAEQKQQLLLTQHGIIKGSPSGIQAGLTPSKDDPIFEVVRLGFHHKVMQRCIFLLFHSIKEIISSF